MASYQDIINKKKKDWDCPDMMDRPNCSKKIPFSSPMLNYATYGGIPRNVMTEFHGAPSGGKSTTSQDICKNGVELFKQEHEAEVERLRELVSKGKKEYAGQLDDLIERGPKRVLYVDLEHSFDDKWASKLGLAPDDIDVMQPPNIPAEQILQTVQEVIETGEVGLLVLDSVPSLVTEAELNKKYGERTVSALAGLLTVFCRKIVPLLTRYECTLLVINQTRDNMDNPYVINTPGGQALKFYSVLRILFRLGTPVDLFGNELPASTEDPAGYLVNAKIIKQKSAPLDRKLGTYYLMMQSGIRPDFDYAKLAISKYGIIRKTGGWYTLCDPTSGEILTNDAGMPLKVNGIAKVYEYLKSNPEYYKSLVKYIENDINGKNEELLDNSSVDENHQPADIQEDYI